ncbi:ubiA prenyltransferase domain-containing 1 homolog [Paramuricea clavata]|uniref:UbiA prenyltransferase domain-containing 1 homolog n=1 Tax=Paramuricea clavata TaxID=317549 RepID=A0A6S7IRQ5_PARCT|nr:ubiA prenyltransferase domain-containing 1 homolog [Paramuricea clavata]
MPTKTETRTWWTYITAPRPWAFSASMTPVALGSVLWYKTTNDFNPLVYVLTCITVVAVQAGGNLVNTYYDYVNGVDSKVSTDKTLVDNVLQPQEVARLAGFSYVVGGLGLSALVFMSSASRGQLALLFFGALCNSFLYTGGPSLKYYGLGDLVILTTFGPLTVLFSYVAQGGSISILPMLYTIPLVLITEAMLHSNNARDLREDRESGIITLAILLGERGSFILYVFLIFTPYVILTVLAMNYTVVFLLPFVTLPITFNLVKCFREKKKDMPKRTSKLNLCLGLLYVVSCLLAVKP